MTSSPSGIISIYGNKGNRLEVVKVARTALHISTICRGAENPISRGYTYATERYEQGLTDEERVEYDEWSKTYWWIGRPCGGAPTDKVTALRYVYLFDCSTPALFIPFLLPCGIHIIQSHFSRVTFHMHALSSFDFRSDYAVYTILNFLFVIRLFVRVRFVVYSNLLYSGLVCN